MIDTTAHTFDMVLSYDYGRDEWYYYLNGAECVTPQEQLEWSVNHPRVRLAN